MVLLGNPEDGAKMAPFARCKYLSSNEISSYPYSFQTEECRRRGFKDLVFLSPKLSSVSFWNKDLMSLQGGRDGGDTARGQRNTRGDNWLTVVCTRTSRIYIYLNIPK